MKKKSILSVDNFTIVVSDKFKDFSSINESNLVMTVSDVKHLIIENKHFGYVFIPGQGISSKIESSLHEFAKDNDALNCFLFWIRKTSQIRSGKNYSHKNKLKNQIISSPMLVEKNTFLSDLLIDESNDIMLDHNTGTHVQGMLIIEAARQMFISVAERYLAGYIAPKNGSYIIDKMDFEFVNFAFPIPIEVKMTIENIEIKSKRKTIISIMVDFFQSNLLVTRSKITFSVIAGEIFNRLEDKLAKTSVHAFIGNSSYEYYNTNKKPKSSYAELLNV